MVPTRSVAWVGDFGLGDAALASGPLDEAGLFRFLKEHGAAVELRLPLPWDLAGEARPHTLRIDSLRGFSPERLAEQLPGLREVVRFRRAVNAMKGPFGCIPAVVRRFRDRLGDEAKRAQLRADLGFPAGASWAGSDAACPGPERSEALTAALARIDALDADQDGVGFLKGLVALVRIQPQDELYETVLLGARAMVLQLLNPECLCMRPDRAVIDAIVADADARVGAALASVLHAPAFARLETLWRTARWMACETVVELVHCPGGARAAFSAGALGAVAMERTGHVALAGVADLAADADALHAWGALAAAHDARVFFDTGPGALADLARADSAEVRRWRALREGAAGAALTPCGPRVLARLPYGDAGTPVREFYYNEDLGAEREHLCWGSAAAVVATSFAGAPSRARDERGRTPFVCAPRYDGGVDASGAPVRAGPLERDLAGDERAVLEARGVRVLRVDAGDELRCDPSRALPGDSPLGVMTETAPRSARSEPTPGDWRSTTPR